MTAGQLAFRIILIVAVVVLLNNAHRAQIELLLLRVRADRHDACTMPAGLVIGLPSCAYDVASVTI